MSKFVKGLGITVFVFVILAVAGITATIGWRPFVGKRQLGTVMPWQFYAGQTDEDLKAMYAYLRTLPPIAHRVDNTRTPTACKKCGQKHGAGDTN